MKQPHASLTLLALYLVLAMVAACAGIQSKQQQIALACEGAASAADAISAAAVAGKVSKADAQRALVIYRGTVPVCEPKPVDHIDPAAYAALLSAAAQLATQKDAIQ